MSPTVYENTAAWWNPVIGNPEQLLRQAQTYVDQNYGDSIAGGVPPDQAWANALANTQALTAIAAVNQILMQQVAELNQNILQLTLQLERRRP